METPPKTFRLPAETLKQLADIAAHLNSARDYPGRAFTSTDAICVSVAEKHARLGGNGSVRVPERRQPGRQKSASKR
jgi:hypothetical protein